MSKIRHLSDAPFASATDIAAVGATAALILYAFLRCLALASTKPLWFDELCTWVVVRQQGIHGIWAALKAGVDGQPPLFHVLERLPLFIFKNEALALRLPDIVCFCLTLVCIFVYTRRRSAGLVAFFCTALLLLTTLYDPSATNARPYALFTACVAFALLCYQRADRRSWVILLGLSLVVGESLHYYTILATVPLGFAEVVFWWRNRRCRPAVWIALGCALLPVIAFAPQLVVIRRMYAAHYWALPSLRNTASFYAWAFQFAVRSFTIDLVLLLALLAGLASLAIRPIRAAFLRDPLLPEYALALGLLALPFVGFAVTKLTHGGLDNRYTIPAVLGFPLLACYLLRRAPRSVTAALLALLLFGIVLQERSFWIAQRANRGPSASPAVPVMNLVRSAGHPDLPVAISEGFVYIQLRYYAPPPWQLRFVSLFDPLQAVRYTGSDTVDRNLLAIDSVYPLHLEPFASFAARHRQFLLYSSGGSWDWWPERLQRDGDAVEPIASDGDRRVYLITLAAPSADDSPPAQGVARQ